MRHFHWLLHLSLKFSWHLMEVHVRIEKAHAVCISVQLRVVKVIVIWDHRQHVTAGQAVSFIMLYMWGRAALNIALTGFFPLCLEVVCTVWVLCCFLLRWINCFDPVVTNPAPNISFTSSHGFTTTSVTNGGGGSPSFLLSEQLYRQGQIDSCICYHSPKQPHPSQALKV